MAASPVQPSDLEVVDLREYRRDDLRPLLEEQAAYWAAEYRWDFSSSKDVILRFIDMRQLYGFVLLQGRVPIGYSYFIHEDRKALVGDLFITERYRDEQAQRFLLSHTLKSAAVFPGVRRIEGQLLALTFNPRDAFVYGRGLSVFERQFMILEGLDRNLKPHPNSASVRLESWSDRYLDAAAELITHSYDGHVDSLINDQYRTLPGARRFLYNSTQHPGCGVFFRKAALLAIDPFSGSLSGMCLGSLVHARVGHITQLCVAPRMRQRGMAYELLRHAIAAFAHHGCEALSLTVTASNSGAIDLYERVGFRVIRKFSAFVWEAG